MNFPGCETEGRHGPGVWASPRLPASVSPPRGGVTPRGTSGRHHTWAGTLPHAQPRPVSSCQGGGGIKAPGILTWVTGQASAEAACESAAGQTGGGRSRAGEPSLSPSDLHLLWVSHMQGAGQASICPQPATRAWNREVCGLSGCRTWLSCAQLTPPLCAVVSSGHGVPPCHARFKTKLNAHSKGNSAPKWER